MKSWDWTWFDDRVCAFDFETSGTRPEYGLQPWRISQGTAWATSTAWLWPLEGRMVLGGGLEYPLEQPDPARVRERIVAFLHWAVNNDKRVCGWNLAFDIAVMIGYGVDTTLIRKTKWLDGLLLWRHLEIEPEYDDRGPKRSYSLKTYVRQKFEMHSGYETEVDYHDPSPAMRAKLWEYHIKDLVFTLKGCLALWRALEPAQQRAALIEADALPHVAEANARGLLIDTPMAHDVVDNQTRIATERLRSLQPFMLGTQAAAMVKPKRKKDVLTDDDVCEKIVRSPTMLAVLMFDDWKLTPLKDTPAGARSTDKEVLHELSFIDPKAKEIKEYREALNNRMKFAETPIEAADYNGDGRAHPQCIIFGTYTGRCTYSSKQDYETAPPSLEKLKARKMAPIVVSDDDVPF